MKKDFLLLVIGIIGGIILFTYLANLQSDFNPEEFGLGENTISRIGQDSKQNIISGIGGEQEKSIETFINYRRENKKIALWLGASQVHGINNFENGNKIAVEYAEMANNKIKFVQASAPNGSLHDLLGLYQIYRQENLKPDWLIIAFVYDDLREKAIQNKIVDKLRYADPNEFGPGFFEIINSRPKKDNEDQNDTWQKIVENFLDNELRLYFSPYKNREKLTAKVKALSQSLSTSFVTGAYKIANTSAENQRFPDIASYLVDYNSQALDSILKMAEKDKTRVLIYRQPIRPTNGAFYHNRKSYDDYWNKIQNEYKNDAIFLDLENLVPDEFWGKTNLGYPDVFHFQNRGHLLLGNAITEFINKQP